MTDDRMDERLREYGARWAAAHPAPDALPDVVSSGGGARRSWAPFAAAAAVVALVGGAAYVAGPDQVTPVAGPTRAPAAPATGAACGEGDVRGTVSLQRSDRDVVGTLALTAARGACTIPRTPRLRLLRDNLVDMGVEYAFDGTDAARVVGERPLRLALKWTGAPCEKPAALVLLVEIAAGNAFRLPLDPDVLPACRTSFERRPARLEALWLLPERMPCSAGDYEVVSATAKRTARGHVDVDAVLRNVSGKHCDIDVKPPVAVADARGRALRLTGVMTLEGRVGPPLPPGTTVRASALWSSYCGPATGKYVFAFRLGDESITLPLADHPVPRCDPETSSGNEEGQVGSGWLEPVEPATRSR